jgi:hypothetical protein
MWAHHFFLFPWGLSRSLLAFDLPSDPTTVANLLEHASELAGGRARLHSISEARLGRRRREWRRCGAAGDALRGGVGRSGDGGCGGGGSGGGGRRGELLPAARRVPCGGGGGGAARDICGQVLEWLVADGHPEASDPEFRDKLVAHFGSSRTGSARREERRILRPVGPLAAAASCKATTRAQREDSFSVYDRRGP